MENNGKSDGFEVGLARVAEVCTKADYDACLKETVDVILSTELRGNSKASYYAKRYGRAPLTVAESEKMAAVFAKYGVTEWRGRINENEDENENENEDEK